MTDILYFSVFFHASHDTKLLKLIKHIRLLIWSFYCTKKTRICIDSHSKLILGLGVRSEFPLIGFQSSAFPFRYKQLQKNKPVKLSLNSFNWRKMWNLGNGFCWGTSNTLSWDYPLSATSFTWTRPFSCVSMVTTTKPKTHLPHVCTFYVLSELTHKRA